MSDPLDRPRSLLGIRDCVGARVENPQGESIGRIEDLVVDGREGHILAAVVSLGGFLGIGDQFHAVPLAAMTFDPLARKFVLNIDRETMKKAPAFGRDSWPDLNHPLWGADMQSFYRFPPYWE